MSSRNTFKKIGRPVPALHLLRGVWASQPDVHNQSNQISGFLKQFPGVWTRQPVSYQRTTDRSFEIVSSCFLEYDGNEVRQASEILHNIKPAQLKDANISSLELHALDQDVTRDSQNLKLVGQPIAVAIDPGMVDAALKKHAAGLYRKGHSNYPGSPDSTASTSKATEGGSNPKAPQQARPTATTRPTMAPATVKAPRAAPLLTSAGSSRTQNAGTTRTSAALSIHPDVDAMIKDGKTFEGEHLVALRKENERYKRENEKLQRDLAASREREENNGDALRESIKKAENLQEISEHLRASKKRGAEKGAEYEGALKKARIAQRSILPDDLQDAADDELDVLVKARARTMKKKMVDQGVEIARLKEKCERLEEEKEGLEGEIDALEEENKYLERRRR